MILQSKLAEGREYHTHEVCALLTDALLYILRRDLKGLQASPLFGLRPCPSLHHVALGVFDSRETQGRRLHERDSVLSRVELQGARKFRFYTLFIIKCGWIRIQNRPNPTKTRVSGSDPTKPWFGFAVGLKKKPTGRFGLDLIKFGPAVEML
jgi:hypothetical protein